MAEQLERVTGVIAVGVPLKRSGARIRRASRAARSAAARCDNSPSCVTARARAACAASSVRSCWSLLPRFSRSLPDDADRWLNTPLLASMRALYGRRLPVSLLYGENDIVRDEIEELFLDLNRLGERPWFELGLIPAVGHQLDDPDEVDAVAQRIQAFAEQLRAPAGRSESSRRAPWCAQPVIRLLRKRRLAGRRRGAAVRAHGQRVRRAPRDGGRPPPHLPLYQFAENPPWFKAELERVAAAEDDPPAGGPGGAAAALRPDAGHAIELVGRPIDDPHGPLHPALPGRRRARISASSPRTSRQSRRSPTRAPSRSAACASSAPTRIVESRSSSIPAIATSRSPAPSSRTASTASPASSPRARGSSIDNVFFHDVLDADVIRGAADDVVISDSNLHDALSGSHGDNHNDLIQILGGGPWTIERSRFGVRDNGAAQLYIDPRTGPAGPVHDVHVESNLFTGSNKDMFFAVNVRYPAQGAVPLATGVEFVNNTIVSANIAAIVLADEYADVPSSRRPLVQNNILGRRSTRSAASHARPRTSSSAGRPARATARATRT